MESSIRDFYKNKSVFITGASGLVGQICMEKLLRCCEVKKIYLLIRNKKDQTWQQRIEKMCEDEVRTKFTVLSHFTLSLT